MNSECENEIQGVITRECSLGRVPYWLPVKITCGNNYSVIE